MQRCINRQYLSKSYFYLHLSPMGRLKLNKWQKVVSPRFDYLNIVKKKFVTCKVVDHVNTFLNHIFICISSPIGRLKLNKWQKVVSPRFDYLNIVENKIVVCNVVEHVNTFPNHIFICIHLP